MGSEENGGAAGEMRDKMEDVAERLRAEKAWRGSEGRYRHLFESVNDAIFLRPIAPEDAGGRFTEVNEAACRLLGYSRTELLHKSPLDVDPDVTSELLVARAEQLSRQNGLIFQARLLSKDGRRIPVEISSHLFEWDDRPMMVSMARDLTERHTAEAALRESERRFREMMENVRLIAIMLDAEGKILFANRFLLGLTGWTLAEVMGQDWFALFIPPDQSVRMGQVYDSLLQRTPVPHYENDIMTRGGERRMVAWNNTELKDAAGKIVGVASIGEDITERKRLENELELRDQRLNSFFNNATAGLCVLDADLRFVQVNETLAQLNGLPVAQHLGKTVGEALPRLAPVLEPLMRRVLLTGEPVLNQQVSGETDAKPGGVRHWMGSYFPVVGVAGREGGLGCVVIEITERKRAQAGLRESDQKFRELAENIDQVFWICDREMTKILYVSPAYERIWGRSCESLYAQPMSFTDAIHPSDRGRILASLERVRRGEGLEEQYRIVWPDGSVRWIHDRGFVVRDEKGEFYRFAGLAEDITERRLLEEKLRQAQKMEAIGQLAGGVAHDFNNILAATLMHLGLLQHNPHLTLGTKEDLKEVETEILRAANLTRQLLLFSRRQAAKAEPFDLNQLLHGLLKMLRRRLEENIEVAFPDPGDAVWVRADAGMLEQVVMNLCINARDAMPKGGRLTLATAVLDLQSQPAKSHPDARPGRFVCLSVTDTGCGMDGPVLERIFEPFFTTKEAGKGTGLGLASVYGIVKQHEGWVEVESAVDQSSCFRVYLPAGTRPSGVSPSPELLEAIPGGAETLLLVEDELSLRRTAALCLRSLGYSVLEAGNGLEAQTIWKQHQEKIALLFTDMVMPGTMTGLDLAERLRKEKSSLKVIISSGYGSDLKGSPPNSGLGNCLSGQTVSGNRLGEGGAGLSRPGLRSRYATRSRPSGIQNEREDFAR